MTAAFLLGTAAFVVRRDRTWVEEKPRRELNVEKPARKLARGHRALAGEKHREPSASRESVRVPLGPAARSRPEGPGTWTCVTHQGGFPLRFQQLRLVERGGYGSCGSMSRVQPATPRALPATWHEPHPRTGETQGLLPTPWAIPASNPGTGGALPASGRHPLPSPSSTQQRA